MIHRKFSTVPLLALGAALFVGFGMPEEVSAQPVYIEEDWELVIGTPDPEGHGPQIFQAMSSGAELGDVHSIFEINHATLPTYQVGGISVQVWSGETNLDYRVNPVKGSLHHVDEVIKWTMTQQVTNGVIKFQIKNGQSESWGNDWGEGFAVQATTSQTAFPQYDPNVSVKYSKVGYCKHRVKKFALKAVRKYGPSGRLISEDTTERIVHQYNPGS